MPLQNLCTSPGHEDSSFHELDPFGERSTPQSLAVPSPDSGASLPNVVNPASILTKILDEPPSCIEVCPGNSDYLIVGTYLLSTSDPVRGTTPEQRRRGSLILFKLDSGAEVELSSFSLQLDCSILDLHFHPIERHIFAASTSSGEVGFFKWQSNPICLDHISSLDVSGGSNVIVTSLAWMKGSDTDSQYEQSTTLAVTLTDGCVRLYGEDKKPLFSNKYKLACSFQSHSQEAWYVAFSNAARLLLSGGDDMALHIYKLGDVNVAESYETSTPLWIDLKSHGAGVTAICPLEQIQTPSQSTHFLTGSYDEYVRVYRLDQAPKRRVVAEKCLGGGVWRLKQIGDSWYEGSSSEFLGQRVCTLVLASCMHTGVRVLQIVRTCGVCCAHDSCVWTIDVVAKFEEHESMNYASDARMVNGELQIVSTSFYDKRLCLWPLEKWSFGLDAILTAEAIRGL